MPMGGNLSSRDIYTGAFYEIHNREPNFQPKEPVQRAQVARVTVLQDLETCFIVVF